MVQLLNLVIPVLAVPSLHNSGFAVSLIQNSCFDVYKLDLLIFERSILWVGPFMLAARLPDIVGFGFFTCCLLYLKH